MLKSTIVLCLSALALTSVPFVAAHQPQQPHLVRREPSTTQAVLTSAGISAAAGAAFNKGNRLSAAAKSAVLGGGATYLFSKGQQWYNKRKQNKANKE
ncbi:hypothetical protein H4R33_006331 [Dimargaris cristalligena]|nr:hypothetical protein H4R33_006331 [Dimargaris cristalligena]